MPLIFNCTVVQIYTNFANFKIGIEVVGQNTLKKNTFISNFGF